MGDVLESVSYPAPMVVAVAVEDLEGGKHLPDELPPYDAGYGTGFIADCRRFFDDKWVRLVVYSITLLTTSCLYYGWQQYSAMLYKGGAYAWLCPDDWNFDADGPCPDQEDSVTKLYSIGTGMEYSFALVAGILLDTFGPKTTGFIGEFFYGVGIVLLVFSGESFQSYIPSIMITAACVNLTAFPALILGDLFPNFAFLALSVVLAAQTGCTMMAPIMYSVWNCIGDSVTLKKMWGYYLLCVWLPCTIFYIIALPTKAGFERELTYARMVTKMERRKKPTDAEVILAAAAEKEKENDSPLTAENRSSNLPLNNLNLNVDASSSEVLSGGPAVMVRALSGSSEDFDLKALQAAQAYGSCVLSEEASSNWSEFWAALMTWDMLGIAVFYMIEIFMYTYYPSVVYNDISEKVSSFLGWFMPTQIVWGLLFGLFMDFFGTTIFMLGLVVALALTYALAPIKNTALEYTVSIIFCIFQSSIFTIKYTYVCEMFDRPHYGKLVGSLGLLGGLASLCNMPVSVADNYQVIFYTYVGISAPMLILAIVLLWRQLGGVSYRTKPLVKPPYTVKKANQKLVAEALVVEAIEE